MKKRFTRIMAAMMLLVTFAIPMGMRGQTRTTVTDQMTHADLAATGSSYTNFSNVSLESDAVYAGNSAREYNNSQYNIQLRSNNSNSGIVTTSSGGTIKSITITVAHGTNTIDVYGKNTAYSAATDLYNSNNQGTKIGSLSSTGTINVTDSYAYVGLRSKSGAIYLSSIDFVWEESEGSAVATTTSIDASNITNTDVYVSTTAGSLTATVTETESGDAISGATVTWTSSDTNVATINNNGAVTLVAAGTTTITASYAGESGVYAISSATYELTVTNSEPYVQPTTIEIIPNYTFWGKSAQFSGDTYSELSGSQDNLSLNWTKGSGSTYANLSAMRFYKDNTLVFTAPEGYEIKSIAITFTQTQSDLTFSPTGFDSETNTWTGSSTTVTMSRPSSGSSYYQITQFVITIGLPSADPSISADDVNIAYNAISGEIAYTLSNPVTGGSLSVSENVDWISNAIVNTSENKVTFTTTANDATSSRSGVITITYTYGDNETVSKNVTVSQAAAPVSYTTIPALFAAATTTETDVYVTFNNWVVSGVSTNGKNVFVTDNNGNGFIIFDNDGGLGNTYSVGDILSGTAVSCVLVKYGGCAELKSVDSNDLTITSGGTVSTSNIAMADLAGVNTGALVHYEGLTCSISNSKYYLSDGTTTLQVYNALYAFSALEDGKTYNITGIYQQYNNTKEILPRSAADIEEVQAQHGDYTLTVSNPQHVTLTVTYGTDGVLANGDNAEIEDGTEISFTATVESGYVLTGVSVVGENSISVTVTETSGVYSFTMPAFNATVSATATDASGVTTYTLATSIESGKEYIIVGWADSTPYAMGAQNTNNRSAVAITISDDVATVTSDDVYEFVIAGNSTDGYTFYDERTPGYLYAASSSSNYLRTQETNDNNGVWTITIASDGNSASVVAKGTNTRKVMQFNNSSTLFSCYSSASQHPVYLYVKDETPTPDTFTLSINGWQTSSGTKHDYYLIASPLNDEIAPADVTNMTSGTFQLFSFDPTNTTEWQSYASHGDMKLKPGQGYLYTHSDDVTLTFTGTAYNGNGEVTLVKNTSNTTQGSWNLVGNSLSTAANIFDGEGGNKTYYRMKSASGSELIIGTGTVAPMEGVFVYADENNEKITFSAANAKENQQLSFNITQGRSEAIDRAIVRFDEGQELPKFQIDPSHTKLYIPQSEDDYAVVRAATDGVMPLNFKAQTNGNYTISINVENVELNTLVLIDNLTGNEVNLLSRAEYSFDATTDDDENRFTLVYSKSGETKTYKLTITADDFNTTSYAANNTEKTSNAVNVDDPTDTYEVVWASNQVMKNTSGQMQWQKGNGRIYNITNMGSITDVTVDGISGGFTTYYGESIEPAWSGITGQPFFQTKTYDDAVGYSTSLEVTFDIEEGAATTYSVTFDAGEGTFVGNEDFPNTENTKAAGIYTLPDASREGYVFNGWLATGTTTPRTGSYTVYTDVEFTAQYTENGASGGNGGTDVLDLEFTGVSGTNYTSWSDKEGESGAVYAGNSAGGNSAIQLRSNNNNSGIITTASGGMISKVVVTWNENTINGRVLNVYGKNTAYTAVTDLYNTSKQGTLLGTITCGTSTELLVSDEYTFIGLRSNSGAMYIDEISITWVLPSNVATPTFSPAAGTYMGTQTVTISCETDGAVIYYTTDGSTPDNTSEVYDGGITVSQTTTIQAIAYVGTEASHVASATYTIVVPQTIAEVREQGTGTVLTSGIVTAVSTNSNGTTAYMQDMTAAIVVYGDFTAEVGDEIQVSGTLTTFRGLLEIGTPTVTVLSQENEVDPTVMTIAEIIEDAEGDNEYQAMLVSIVEATVTEINGNNTIIAQDENTITVYGSLGDVEEDDVISFTGNIGCYNTVQIVNPTDIEIQGSTTMPTFITEGDWNVAENWSTGVVPNNDDDVVLNANVTITGIAEANSINQGSYTITIEDGGQLRFNEDYIRATVKKFVPGYGAGNENARAGYKLLTNPINVYETSQIEGLLTGNYDVYYWDETADGEEWRNIEDGDNYFYWPDIYGYLYANEEDVTLSFTGTVYANFVYNQYEVTYHEGHAFSGLNLIGNTFVCETYLTNEDETEVLPYYRMNETGDRLVAVNTATPIAPMEAIFYHQANEWAWVNFNRTAPTSDKGANLNMVVSEGRGTVDNAIVSFNNHNTLEKFSFSESGSKLYIPQNGKDYAVVYSEGIGEMPVNFKATQNGTYTLSFSNDNVEFSYLHLIDNMTGAEVDLLANPSYSFEAKSSDYASRFKLVFVVNEDNLNNNDNFAFVSNGNIVINGEGTLQVIDMTGRIVSVEEVNGMSNVNVNAAGVYVLQLTNGESVKTQKIVVK